VEHQRGPEPVVAGEISDQVHLPAFWLRLRAERHGARAPAPAHRVDHVGIEIQVARPILGVVFQL
jgi:hypothetical protein